ncbi:MAG TPA: phosphotransferase [Nocardioidaceae bacterium]|nr:phosphotransferase [Nocardioidaceae bacterium]
MSITALAPATVHQTPMTPPPVLAPAPGSGSPMPLPLPGWGAADALAALREAGPLLPVPLADPTVVSALTTVVLRAGAYAVKVYPPGTDPDHLSRLTAALGGSTAAHLPCAPPVVTGHGVLVLSEWLPAAGPVSWSGLGSLLRRFHDQHAATPMVAWTPLSRLAGQAALLPPDVAGVLLEAQAELLAALADVRSELGEGLIHGDVSPSNVIGTPDGPRLIDLDWVARAPREYDLSSASRRFRAGEIPRRAYAGFCRGYGYDVCSWPGLAVLDRIADLGGVAFRIWDSLHHGRGLHWLDEELPGWRTPL